MSLCIDPQCNTKNPGNPPYCQVCGSELLLKGRYRVVRRLSGGGFGTTYEVNDQYTPRVLKVLHNNSTKAVELFQREAKFLSSTNHPGIPKAESNGYFIYHPKDSLQPLHCLVMEKIEGENLREYIKQRGQPIEGDVALKWLHELVVILDRVHSQDIIHRDIKPNNIMLKPDGRLALIDFGAVQEGTGTEGVTEKARAGTGTEKVAPIAGRTNIFSKAYAAPEQIEGHAIKQSDFFSLGRTFIFLLTAKDPNDSLMYDAFDNRINWRDRAEGVSSQLADLIDQMMAWTPRERPVNTQAILQLLEQINKTLPSPIPVPVDPPLSPPIKDNKGSEKAPSRPPSYQRFSILIFIIGLLSSVLYMGIPMLVGGIFAMILASRVNSQYEDGDYTKSRKTSKRTKTTLKIIGTLSTILAVVVTAIAIGETFGYGNEWLFFAFAGIINITISIRLLSL